MRPAPSPASSRQPLAEGRALNLPLVLEGHYLAWLDGQRQAIASLHVPLPLPLRLDHRLQDTTGTLAALRSALAALSGIPVYALLNVSQPAADYLRESRSSRHLLQLLWQLCDATDLRGIVFGNLSLLHYLGTAAPELAARLEAVPGVNLHLDCSERISEILAAIARTGFRPPSRLVLDRELNRDLPRLLRVTSECRAVFPHLRLELLANEGCLPSCPAKGDHDDAIARRTLPPGWRPACIPALDEAPWRLLTATWIRPEDQHTYLALVDGFKLCGRTLGGGFLMRAASAWIRGRYDGNLLDLLDTPNWLAGQLWLDNRSLPTDFVQRVASCDRDCPRCGYCAELFRQVARPCPLRLPDLRLH